MARSVRHTTHTRQKAPLGGGWRLSLPVTKLPRRRVGLYLIAMVASGSSFIVPRFLKARVVSPREVVPSRAQPLHCNLQLLELSIDKNGRKQDWG